MRRSWGASRGLGWVHATAPALTTIAFALNLRKALSCAVQALPCVERGAVRRVVRTEAARLRRVAEMRAIAAECVGRAMHGLLKRTPATPGRSSSVTAQRKHRTHSVQPCLACSNSQAQPAATSRESAYPGHCGGLVKQLLGAADDLL